MIVVCLVLFDVLHHLVKAETHQTLNCFFTAPQIVKLAKKTRNKICNKNSSSFCMQKTQQKQVGHVYLLSRSHAIYI